MDWRLARMAGEAGAHAAVVVGEHVLPLPGEDVGALLEDWERTVERLSELRPGEGSMALEEVTLLCPLPPATTIFCAGANYVDHVLEMTGKPPAPKVGGEPFFFMKPGPQSLVGPDATVALPHEGVELDWEAEVAVVVGRDARHVREEQAMACVAGYTIVNDLSARDLMKRSDVVFTYDWIGQKAFPGALPAGP